MAESKWSNTLYVRCYRLARSGYSNMKISKAIGVTWTTFRKWMKKKPSLRKALKEGRRDGTVKSSTFKEYVYARLPHDLQKVWDQINAKDNQGSSLEAMEALLADKGEKERQQLFLFALTHHNFNPSMAMKSTCTSKKDLENWCRDPDFANLYEEIEYHKLNFVDGAVMDLVAGGDRAAVIFAAESLIPEKYGKKVKVEHSGTTTQRKVVAVEELDLDLGTRKALLKAHRARLREEQGIEDNDEDQN